MIIHVEAHNKRYDKNRPLAKDKAPAMKICLGIDTVTCSACGAQRRVITTNITKGYDKYCSSCRAAYEDWHAQQFCIDKDDLPF